MTQSSFLLIPLIAGGYLAFIHSFLDLSRIQPNSAKALKIIYVFIFFTLICLFFSSEQETSLIILEVLFCCSFLFCGGHLTV